MGENGGFQHEYKEQNLYSSIDTWAKTKTPASLQPWWLCEATIPHFRHQETAQMTPKNCSKRLKPHRGFEDTQLSRKPIRWKFGTTRSGAWKFGKWSNKQTFRCFFSGRLGLLFVNLPDFDRLSIRFKQKLSLPLVQTLVIGFLPMVDCCQLGNLPTLPFATHLLLLVMNCSHGTTQGFDGIRAETFTLGCEGDVPMTTVEDTIRKILGERLGEVEEIHFTQNNRFDTNIFWIDIIWQYQHSASS